ncbi:MAG: bifunctional serine/threonine-protein kinase/formylglycine-generating enzyme family protein [Acidobacteriota bacterium]
MSPTPAIELTLGTIIDNKYRVESLMGQGGMGKVFRVTHLQLNKTFALKLMSFDDKDTDTNRVLRFKREAEALARIAHPNIVMVTDFGVMSVEQTPYIVMEYIEGITLRKLLRNQSQLSEEQTIHIAKQMCAGLHEAHLQGIIHRDLKPENIMVQQFADGELVVRILDFGIAKLLERPGEVSGENITGKDAPGTLKYMAPEQFLGLPVDGRTDVFGICLIMYEALTGVVAPVMVSRVKPVHHLREDISPKLSDIILRGLSTTVQDRHETALELKRELEAYEQGITAEVPVFLEKATGTQAPAGLASYLGQGNTGPLQPALPTLDQAANETVKLLPKRHNYFIAAIFILLLLSGIGGVGFYRLYPQQVRRLLGLTEETSGKLATSAIPQLINIKGGEFKMGTDSGDAFARPQHQVSVVPFQVSKFLITNRLYAEFVKQTGQRPPSYWQGNTPPTNILEQPVREVSWNEANAYCGWLTSRTGHNYRLLSEKEWEYLARNSIQFTVEEILGDYLEWTSTEFHTYPGAKIEPPPMAVRTRIFRGKTNESKNEPLTYRIWQTEDYTFHSLGFRVACDDCGH